MTLLVAANYGQTRRHYAKALENGEGYALCSLQGADANRVKVYDQDALDRGYRRWGAPPPKANVDLPLCKRCSKSAATHGLEAAT